MRFESSEAFGASRAVQWAKPCWEYGCVGFAKQEMSMMPFCCMEWSDVRSWGQVCDLVTFCPCRLWFCRTVVNFANLASMFLGNGPFAGARRGWARDLCCPESTRPFSYALCCPCILTLGGMGAICSASFVASFCSCYWPCYGFCHSGETNEATKIAKDLLPEVCTKYSWIRCCNGCLSPFKNMLASRGLLTAAEAEAFEITAANKCCDKSCELAGMCVGKAVFHCAACSSLACAPVVVPWSYCWQGLLSRAFDSALTKAVRKGALGAVLAILDASPGEAAKANGHELALHIALLLDPSSCSLSDDDHLHLVQALLSAHPQGADVKNIEGLWPLQLALWKRRPRAILAALTQKSSPSLVHASLQHALEKQWLDCRHHRLQVPSGGFPTNDNDQKKKEFESAVRAEYSRYNGDIDRLRAVVNEDLPITDRQGLSWFVLLTSALIPVDIVTTIVEDVFQRHEDQWSRLAYSKDEKGRCAIDVAPTEAREVMQRFIYFCGNYEFVNVDKPTHMSSTSVVHIATDFSAVADSQLINAANVVTTKDKSSGRKVAVKLMKQEDQFLREVESRQTAALSDEFVCGILYTHSAKTFTGDFAKELSRFKFEGYPYVIVMAAADKNLKNVIDSERIAGRDWNAVRNIGLQVAQALEHMHAAGLVHGDVKTLNIARVGGKYLLIDLDASQRLHMKLSACLKWSSAYIAPELICRLPDEQEGRSKIVVRQPGTVPDDLLVEVAVSQDIWAFAAVLYQLGSGETLFQANDEDNIDQENLEKLMAWGQPGSSLKEEKLAKVAADPVFRSLLTQMLHHNPAKRPPSMYDHHTHHPI